MQAASKGLLGYPGNNASSRHVIIFDDGKQSFSKIQTNAVSPHQRSQAMSYFTKDQAALGSNSRLNGGSEFQPPRSKRHLYSGVHEVPVFNLKISSQPILVSFRFNIFRLVNKSKIFVQAKLL